jgi:hypothetical protein
MICIIQHSIAQTNLINQYLDEPYLYEKLFVHRTDDNIKALQGYLANGTKPFMRQLFNKYKTDKRLQDAIEAAVFDSPLPQLFGPVVRMLIY